MSHFLHDPSPKIWGNIEPYPGNHSGSPALRHRLLIGIARIRDNLLLELEVLCPKVGEELDADIAFTDGDEGQQGTDGEVGGQSVLGTSGEVTNQ
jgi:hypothetical protein